MLTSIRVKGFKSLRDTGDVPLAPLTCILGPNGSGKTALLEAVRVHAALAWGTPVSQALKEVASDPVQAISLPEDGRRDVLSGDEYRMDFGCGCSLPGGSVESRFGVLARLRSGTIGIDRAELRVWHRDALSTPAVFDRHNTISLKSFGEIDDQRIGPFDRSPLLMAPAPGLERPDLPRELAGEFLGFQYAISYYDLRSATIRTRYPSPEFVTGIGVSGSDLIPWLYWAQERDPSILPRISRAVGSVVPNFGGIEVGIAAEGRIVDLFVTFEGKRLLIEQASDGLIRVIMLATVMHTSTSEAPAAALIEEPEHGIHPHLQGRMVKLLASRLGRSPLQVIFTTHSPFVAWHVMKLAAEKPDLAAVLVARCGPEGSTFRKLTTDDFAYYAKQRGEDDPLADPAGFIDAYERGVLDA